MGVLNKIFAGLAPKPGKADQLVIDATHPKARGTAASPKKCRLRWATGCKKGGLNSKLHAVCDGLTEILAIVITCLKRLGTPKSRFFVCSG
jgi:hypothetical protein